MALRTEHELHRRRRSRNVGLGIVLASFVVLVFALTVVKVRQGDLMEGFDHQPRVSVLPPEAPTASQQTEEAAE
ncbi:hypothetical protein H4P12_15075 [Paracoccus sp. 11-3]|uniref:Cytochrome C oxidase assembly protein n=1 Tax=Paracoccus amoyensis TaxID=2760093 RepID=A0A926GQB1_9RHOB|nr:hypothetical protein [Paracoccus amoyensis]MBC9248000.1 hypothetical protein [Paracoccus amoyensis]